jgi:hypothetical protein
MKVRAVATAAEKSNAIGTVELEGTPHGLLIVYLGLASFREGYAPPSVTSGTSVLVPWASVLEARIEGDRLWLELEPKLTPHSRLTLAGFSSAIIHQRELSRQRLAWRIATGGMAAIGSLLAALTAPRLSPEVGAVLTITMAVGTALALLAVGWIAELRLVRAQDERVTRATFLGELSVYLPKLSIGPRPKPPLLLPQLPDLTGVVPRTTLAVVITLSSGLLAVLLVARWMVSSERRDQERARMEARLRAEQRLEVPAGQERTAPVLPEPKRVASESRPATPAAVSASEPPSGSPPAPANGARSSGGGECRCVRPYSLLWADPMPRLSTFLLSRHQTTHEDRRRLEVEVAVVNNGDQELREITLVLNFIDQESSAAESMVRQRGAYFEGPLAPGQAIKWSIDCRGTGLEIKSPLLGTLGPGGEGVASADALATLLKANHRPVRLHGAMMLAFLGDPRARAAALALAEAQREDESSYLTRVLAATDELKVCELSWQGPERRRIEACVFNASAETRSELGLGVRVLARKPDPVDPLGEPPTVLHEIKVRIMGQLSAGKGARIRAELPESAPTGAVLEGRADRFDLLPGG